MLSDKIKTSLLRYWRSKNYWASFEVHSPYGDIEDIVAFKETHIVVVEIKISLSDLKRDIKKKKHKKIAKRSYRYMANHYYFCVPKELEEKALKYIEKKHPLFGLMIYDGDKAKVETIYFGKRNPKPYIQMGGKPISVTRRAKKIAKNPQKSFIKSAMNSMCNQLTRLMEKKFYMGES